MRKLALSLIATSLICASAYAVTPAEKVVAIDTIQQMEGIVHVMMPCNWLRNLTTYPVQVMAIYKDGDNTTEVEIDASSTVSGRYMIVNIPQGVISETLDYIRVIYKINENVRCEGGYGQEIITQ